MTKRPTDPSRPPPPAHLPSHSLPQTAPPPSLQSQQNYPPRGLQVAVKDSCSHINNFSTDECRRASISIEPPNTSLECDISSSPLILSSTLCSSWSCRRSWCGSSDDFSSTSLSKSSSSRTATAAPTLAATPAAPTTAVSSESAAERFTHRPSKTSALSSLSFSDAATGYSSSKT
jgi:hypothetical protein